MSSSYTRFASINLFDADDKDNKRETSSGIEGNKAERMYLMPSSHILGRTYDTFEEKTKSTFHLPNEEKTPRKAFAQVYIWKAKLKGDHNKSVTGHVSMQLFTAEGKEISFEQNGYISIYPGNPNANYTLLLTSSHEKKISPSDIPTDTILLKKQPIL